MKKETNIESLLTKLDDNEILKPFDSISEEQQTNAGKIIRIALDVEKLQEISFSLFIKKVYNVIGEETTKNLLNEVIKEITENEKI